MGLFNRTKSKEETPVAAPQAKLQQEKRATTGPSAEAAASELILRVLRAPYVTEKAVAHTAQGQYVFAVASNANKLTVAKAIHARYGVKPVKINMVKVKGKKKGFREASGFRKDWKKAYVMLRKGDSIAAETATAKKEATS